MEIGVLVTGQEEFKFMAALVCRKFVLVMWNL